MKILLVGNFEYDGLAKGIRVNGLHLSHHGAASVRFETLSSLGAQTPDQVYFHRPPEAFAA